MKRTLKLPMPPMPKRRPSFQASGPEVKLCSDFGRYSTGSMALTITEVKVSKNGKKLGAVRCESAGRAVLGLIGKRTWSIDVEELWNMFARVDEMYMEEVTAHERGKGEGK